MEKSKRKNTNHILHSFNIYIAILILPPIFLGIALKIVFVSFFALDSTLIFIAFCVGGYIPYLFIGYFALKRKIHIRRISLVGLVILNIVIGALLPSLFNNQLNHLACTSLGRSFVSELEVSDIKKTFCGQLIKCYWVDLNEETWEACIVADPLDQTKTALFFNFELAVDSPMVFLASLKHQENKLFVNSGYVIDFDPILCKKGVGAWSCDDGNYPIFQILPYKET